MWKPTIYWWFQWFRSQSFPLNSLNIWGKIWKGCLILIFFKFQNFLPTHQKKKSFTSSHSYFKKKILSKILYGNHMEKLCFTQISTRIAAWLLLTFFKCLHNQLSSIHSITTYWRVQMFENVIHQIASSFLQVLRQNFGWFLS